MDFQEVTITPIEKPDGTIKHYYLSVDCNPGTENLWTMPGSYDTAEAAVDSFSPRLKPHLAQHILNVLKSGESITFTLEDAFDGFI
jgi:hypothetical protein